MLARHGHFNRVQDRALGLRFNVLGAAIPELCQVEGSVVDCRRVAVALLALVTVRGRLIIDAILVEQVAGVAGEVVAFRDAGLKVENAAELDLGLGGWVGCGLHRLWQRLESAKSGFRDFSRSEGAGGENENQTKS